MTEKEFQEAKQINEDIQSILNEIKEKIIPDQEEEIKAEFSKVDGKLKRLSELMGMGLRK